MTMSGIHEPTSIEAITRATANRWKEQCELHWSNGTLRELLPLLAEDVVYRILPNREPDVGHEALGRAYDTWQAAARGTKVRYLDPIVDGDRAVVEWWCRWMEDGQPMTMVGVTQLRVDGRGLIVEVREYWSAFAGDNPPYDGWDRGADQSAV